MTPRGATAEQKWSDMVTYARAAGANSYDQANAWCRAMLGRGPIVDMAEAFRRIDYIAQVERERTSRRPPDPAHRAR